MKTTPLFWAIVAATAAFFWCVDWARSQDATNTYTGATIVVSGTANVGTTSNARGFELDQASPNYVTVIVHNTTSGTVSGSVTMGEVNASATWIHGFSSSLPFTNLLAGGTATMQFLTSPIATGSVTYSTSSSGLVNVGGIGQWYWAPQSGGNTASVDVLSTGGRCMLKFTATSGAYTDAAYLQLQFGGTLGLSTATSGGYPKLTFGGASAVNLYIGTIPSTRAGIVTGSNIGTALNTQGGNASMLKVQLFVDLNGDGNYTAVGTFYTDSAGNGTMPSSDAWDGKNWKAYVVGEQVDGKWLPVDILVGSGQFGGVIGPTTISGSYVETSNGTTGAGQTSNVSVDSNGNVLDSNGSKFMDGLTATTTTVNGQVITKYTYDNPDTGSRTTITYNGSGSTSATTADVRELTMENNAGNDGIISAVQGAQTQAHSDAQQLHADEQALLNQGAQTLAAINSLANASPSPSASPSPAATPSPTASPTATPGATPTGQQIFNSLYGNIDTQPNVAAPGTYNAPDVGGGGGGAFWQATLGPFGTINFDPASNPTVGALAAWIKLFLTYLATGLLIRALANMTWEVQVAISAAPQALVPNVEVAGNSVGTLLGAILPAVIVASVVGGTTIWSTYANTIVPGGSGMDGSNVVTSAVNLFGGQGNAALGAAIQLTLFFVPIAHFGICIGNYFIAYLFRGTLYAAYQAVRKLLFAGG